MIKYDERLTRISQEEYLQIIRNNANTMAIVTSTNPTKGLDSKDLVEMIFDAADRYKESLGPWTSDSNGYFIFNKALGGYYRVHIEEDLKKERRYYFKNEEHHLLIRLAYGLEGETTYDNHPSVRVSVLKYLFEE